MACRTGAPATVDTLCKTAAFEAGITWAAVKTLSMGMGVEEIISADWKGLPACWADEEEEAAAGSAKGMLGIWGTPWDMPCVPAGMCSLSKGEK